VWRYPQDFLWVWDGYGDRNSVPTAALQNFRNLLTSVVSEPTCPVRAAGLNAPLIRFFISALYKLFACLYHTLRHLPFFLHLFLTYLLSYLSFPLRIDPLHFQAGCHKTTKPGFSLDAVYDDLYSPVLMRTGSNEKELILTNLTK